MANTIIIFMLMGAFFIPCLIAIIVWAWEKREGITKAKRGVN
jgi:hypothetical protein